MYIFEIFVKWLNKNKRGNTANYGNLYKEGIYLNKEGEIIDSNTDLDEDCSHKFMPIDSTGKTLACIYCGLVIKHREDKTKNKG